MRWTTREGVARELIGIIDGGFNGFASSAARLVDHLSTPDLAPDLLRLARSRDSPRWVRIHALRGLARVGARVPLEALRDLLDEQPLAPDDGPRSCAVAPPTTPDLLDLVRVATDPEQLDLTCAWLARAAPAVRTKLLHDSIMVWHRPAPELVTWLFDRWLDEIARRGPEKADADAARWICGRHPETDQVELLYWARHTRDTAALIEAARRQPRLQILLDGGARLEAARRLALPLADLLSVLGFHGLRSTVKAAVHAMSAHLARPIPPRDEALEDWFRGACHVLGEWPESAAIAGGLLQGARLAPSVRRELATALFRHDRETAFRAALAHPEGAATVGALVCAMRREPADGDGPRLLQAVRFPDEEVRYRAVDALEAAGEESAAWRDVLRAFARSAPPVLRIRAAAALAQRGEAGHREALIEAAAGEPDVRARAEAIRRLARLDDAARHVDLFERALLTDHARSGNWDYHQPAAEQAAIALGVVGGERVLTPLLQGYLLARSNATVDVIEPIFTLLDEEASAPSSPRERLARIQKADQGWATLWEPYERARFGLGL